MVPQRQQGIIFRDSLRFFYLRDGGWAGVSAEEAEEEGDDDDELMMGGLCDLKNLTFDVYQPRITR